MNRYSVITTIILIILTFGCLWIFDVDSEWYYFIVPVALGYYIGNVVSYTKQGFNIQDLVFEDSEEKEDLKKIHNLNEEDKLIFFHQYEDLQQWFRVSVVKDFKGTMVVFKGCFVNHLNIGETDLRILLNKKARQDKILKALNNGEIVVEHYTYGSDDYVEVIFTSASEMQI